VQKKPRAFPTRAILGGKNFQTAPLDRRSATSTTIKKTVEQTQLSVISEKDDGSVSNPTAGLEKSEIVTTKSTEVSQVITSTVCDQLRSFDRN